MERIIDAHCHIYPDALGQRAVQSVDHFYGGLPTRHHDGTVQTLRISGNACQISHFIVHSVATKPEQVSSINRFLAGSMADSKGAFTALGTLHPFSETLKGDLEELISLGLTGVKLHPDIQRFAADSMEACEVYELCQEKKLPVLVHTGDYRYDYSNPQHIVPILRYFPDLKFIGAHFGGWSVWEEAVRTLSSFPNIWVDTSSSLYWLKPEQAREYIRAYGSKRVMFGTDYPFWPQDWEINYLLGLGLEPEEVEDVFWRTCAQLFQITFEGKKGENDA